MSEQNPLTDLLLKLTEAVNNLNNKLDGVVAKPEQKRGRGRPKGSKNKTKESIIEVEEDSDEDEDDDFEEDMLSRNGTIKRGRRPNLFDGTQYSVPQKVVEEDKKAMELFETGQLKRARKRPPAKMGSATCSGCGRKFKDFKSNIDLQTSPEGGYRCNRCAGGGA